MQIIGVIFHTLKPDARGCFEASGRHQEGKWDEQLTFGLSALEQQSTEVRLP
jgi:hypothetical protein